MGIHKPYRSPHPKPHFKPLAFTVIRRVRPLLPSPLLLLPFSSLSISQSLSLYLPLTFTPFLAQNTDAKRVKSLRDQLNWKRMETTGSLVLVYFTVRIDTNLHQHWVSLSQYSSFSPLLVNVPQTQGKRGSGQGEIESQYYTSE